ncbi:MAG: MoaD/ThiS family protein [Verrucomicrobia bacterium]|nr:MoaD/ThiS family protein [Verrucomicrobiota bacterium]MDE3097882.1 MoaD/ThiS family protein [Verrucomicrobiota bacterium]
MRVLFFAQLKDVTGCESAEIEAASLDSERLWRELLKKFPALAAHRAATRLARNWEYAGPNAIFASGDEIALIPPVSGG